MFNFEKAVQHHFAKGPIKNYNRLAREMRTDRSTVIQIVNTNNPRMLTLLRFAAAFGVPLKEFIATGYENEEA